jgi:hypothetical protein
MTNAIDKAKEILYHLGNYSVDFSENNPSFFSGVPSLLEESLHHALLSAVFLRAALEVVKGSQSYDAYSLLVADLEHKASSDLAFSWEYDGGIDYTKEATLYKAQLDLLFQLL